MQDTVSFYLSILYRDFLRHCNAELRKLGLSYGQLPFILYTAKHPNCTHTELTRALHMDWGHSQRAVAKLVDNGFMEKICPEENACHCLSLTEKGQEAFQKSHDLFLVWDREHLTGISQDDQQVLKTLLRKILSEMKKEEYHG